MKSDVKEIRCAIYTRKSSEEGLDQEFNSLDAQREAGEAYITSQKHEGWKLIAQKYDDGGYSGGSMERPALAQLLKDIKQGIINVVVVYKVDRISRSLTDFAQIVQVFEEHNVSFVSVTQNFNTTSSMGRLTLNILLSFAQFEREVIGERIRDKFSASKKKGMWMGGQPALGYDIIERKLIVNNKEAEIVRHIFTRFTQTRSATALVDELERDNIRTKSYISNVGRHHGGRAIDKSFLYRFFRNRLYLGETVHKDKTYQGQHEAIISQELWDSVHKILNENPTKRGNESRRQNPALLQGIIHCGCCGCAMTPASVRRDDKLYRYYVPVTAIKRSYAACKVGPIPAGEIEDLVVNHIRQLIRTPENISKIWNCTKNKTADIGEREVFDALNNFDAIWDNLFPKEQQRLIRLMTESIIVNTDNIKVTLRIDGLSSIIRNINFSRLQGKD